jgi:hypothetical protein
MRCDSMIDCSLGQNDHNVQYRYIAATSFATFENGALVWPNESLRICGTRSCTFSGTEPVVELDPRRDFIQDNALTASVDV